MQAFRDLLNLAESAHAAIMADLGSVDHDPEEIRAAEDVMQRARDALAAHDAAVSAGGIRADGREIVGHDWDNGPQSWDVLRDDGEQWWALADPDFSARIVACVNACTGIADPVALVAAARGAADWIADYVPDDVGGRGFHLADLRNALNGA